MSATTSSNEETTELCTGEYKVRAFTTGTVFKGDRISIPTDQLEAEYMAGIAEEKEFWKSAVIDAELIVELPFWMLIEDGEIEVDYGKTKLTVRVDQNFLAVYDGPLFLGSHANICWIGHQKQLPNDEHGEGVPCPVFRKLKSVLIVPVRIREGIIETLSSHRQIEASDHPKVRQYNRATQYANTLAFAHLPALNNLIEKYRSSSHDPFAFEITEFDVPSWSLRTPNGFCHFIVMPYWANDTLPSYNSEGISKPFVAADVNALSTVSIARLTPGQRELLDAVSYMFRGRYNESIRYSVTAIEVLVEEQLRLLYAKDGLSKQDVDQKLIDNQMKFHERIEDYERLSGKRLPGPTTHYIHYLNGIRLREELASVRLLRHAIVHRGKRISLFERGIARRCVETMTWLYQSIVEDQEFDRISDANFAYFGSMRGEPSGRYNVDFNPTYIEVIADGRHVAEETEPITSRELNFRSFWGAFFSKDNDPELVTAMALTYLDIHVQDGSFGRSPVQEERFIGVTGQGEWLMVAFVDEPSHVTQTTLQTIKAKLAAREQEFGQDGNCIIVTCLSKVSSIGQSKAYYKLDPALLAMTAQEGVRLLTPLDLFQIGFGVERLNWDTIGLVKDLLNPVQSIPSCYSSLGRILAYFPKHNAIGFRLEAGSSIKRGDCISVEQYPAFVEFPIESVHSNRQLCDTATGPCEVGIGLPITAKSWKPRVGAKIFMRSDSPLTVQNTHLYSQAYPEAFFENQRIVSDSDGSVDA
jgi:hypothetical protein